MKIEDLDSAVIHQVIKIFPELDDDSDNWSKEECLVFEYFMELRNSFIETIVDAWIT